MRNHTSLLTSGAHIPEFFLLTQAGRLGIASTPSPDEFLYSCQSTKSLLNAMGTLPMLLFVAKL